VSSRASSVPELAARLDLGHGRADQLTVDVLADIRALGAPALAVPRPVPVVAVEVEDLHLINGNHVSRDMSHRHRPHRTDGGVA
jgi:hypothetical protein